MAAPLLAALAFLAIAFASTRSLGEEGAVKVSPIAIPYRPTFGPFALTGVWEVESDHPRFGGYSALLPLARGRLVAIGDRGYSLEIAPGPRPGAGIIRRLAPDAIYIETSLDSEAATADPVTGRRWIAWEGENAITRHDRGSRQPQLAFPPAMSSWPRGRGAEAMVRLADGRFVVLREGFGVPDDMGLFGGRRHEALIFARDPLTGTEPEHFWFAGPSGFSPVDMAQMPDGRVLVLMRRLVWPFPAKFAGRILIADPRDIRPGAQWTGTRVATLTTPLPFDNFEGLAIVPAARGKLNIWLMSDDNRSPVQRTLIWRLAVDPAQL